MAIKTAQNLREIFKFKWADKINYLGIELTREAGKLCEQNFPPLLTEIEKEMRRWNNG